MRLVLPLLLIACGGGTGSVADSGAPEPAVDRYDPEHLTEVSATLSPPDWDALLHESRLFYEILLGPDCFSGPIPNVFTWYPGEVTIDGETLAEVGFRKKGLIGSLSWTRPSLKVDSDRFVDGQEFSDGTEHFTFNNNKQDPSRLHPCLAYAVFREAGIPAPLCAYATMEVNGEDLGVYANVEPIKKDFLRRNYDEDEGELYEGSASDFNGDFVPTFDIKYGADRAPLTELANALLLPDDQLIPRLEELIDLDGFVTMWVVDGVLAHWDGYSHAGNNFYVYHSVSDGKLRFIPWGADAVFEDPGFDPLPTGGLVASRLWDHPQGRARFEAEARRVLDEVWDETWLHSEIDRMEDLIKPHTLDPVGNAAAIQTVRDFVDGRRSVVEGLLASPPVRPMIDKPKWCMDPIGDLQISFDTEWGSLESDPFAHPTTMTGTLNGQPILNEELGTVAGDDGYNGKLLAVLATDAAFTQLVQVVLVLPEELDPGTYPVDLATIPGYIVTVDLTNPYDEGQLVALLGGELVLEEAGYTPGATLRGTVSATLLPNIFE